LNCDCGKYPEGAQHTGLDCGVSLPHPRVLARVYKEIEDKYPAPVITEDQKQKYFEEGYDQCFAEVIDEVNRWNHPDTKSFVMWLKNTFKLSAAKLPRGD